MTRALDWMLKNPDRVIYLTLTLVAIVARFAGPGTRWGAAVTAMGGDLVKLWCAIRGVPMPGGFSPAPATVPSTPEAAAKMPGPKPSNRPPPMAPSAGLFGAALVCVVLAGCSSLSGKGPATAIAVGDIVACVLSHDGDPVEQIAKECEGVAIQDVIDIVNAHKRAMAHDAACAPKVAP